MDTADAPTRDALSLLVDGPAVVPAAVPLPAAAAAAAAATTAAAAAAAGADDGAAAAEGTGGECDGVAIALLATERAGTQAEAAALRADAAVEEALLRAHDDASTAAAPAGSAVGAAEPTHRMGFLRNGLAQLDAEIASLQHSLG
jgi:hypothetical protein